MELTWIIARQLLPFTIAEMNTQLFALSKPALFGAKTTTGMSNERYWTATH